jgi:hypothetical protein
MANVERASQPSLFGESIMDPERRLARLHGDLQNPFKWNKNVLIAKEVQRKKAKLRILIGLPVVRGKDEHVNDRFYKFLVKISKIS